MDNTFKIKKVTNPFLKFMKNSDNFSSKYKLYKNTNFFHTFLNTDSIDIVAVNEKNHVIYRYENAPKNIVCEVRNPKEKTSILVLPKRASSHMRIGDILTFEDKYEF